MSPAAKAVVEREFGKPIDSGPGSFIGTEAPTFAAIVSLREGGGMLRQPPEVVARADVALRRLPVTPADRIARCARYDNEVPRFVLPADKPRLLLFEKINGFKDTPSVNAAHDAFVELARQNGWALVTTDRGGAFNPATLRQFDAVIWNNVSGDVLTLSQRRAFRAFIERGGAFIGVHGSGGDPAYFWEWYADKLIGARFLAHPMNTQFQDARISVESVGHPVTTGLPGQWVMNDEWYSFRSNPRKVGATILATLDEDTYKPEGHGRDLRMGDHPIAWTNCIGKGRMFYSAIGHRPETYTTPEYRLMLTNAVNWVTQRSACSASR